MKSYRLTVLVALAVAVGVGTFLGTVDAQKTKGKTRAATTKQLMKGFVSVNCGALGKALKAKEADWDEIALRAALLNEAGHILMADGRCPDGEWAGGAKTVQKCSDILLKKVADKDLEGAKSAFAALTKDGCGKCHKAHKG